MAARVTQEWHENGKLRRKKVPPGMKGVRQTDIFVIEWTDPHGKRCRQKIKARGRQAKRLADDRAAQITSAITLGTYQSGDTATWEDFRERYTREILPTKRSKRSREELLFTFDRFEAKCNPKKMTAITTALIDRFIAARLKDKGCRGKTLSAATVNKDLRNLQSALGKALRWKLISELPDFDMLDELQHEKPLVTVKEFLAMYDACDLAGKPGDQPFPPVDWWRALLVTGFGTGQRIGDLLSLEWARVDLTRRRWKSLAEDSKGKRDRLVDFNEQVANHLLRIRQMTDPRVFPWNQHKTTLYAEMRKIQEAAGLDPKRPDFKFHAYRRSFVTFNWDLLGPDEVQKRTGHKSQSTTERYRVYVEERREPSKDSFMPPIEDNENRDAC